MRQVPPDDYLEPKLRILYRQRRVAESPELWSYWYAMKYRTPRSGSPVWYIPIRWDGMSRLVFVGQQPSSVGDFPGSNDKLFWDLVVESRLARLNSSKTVSANVQICYEGPFVTDLVPERAKVVQATDLRTWPQSKCAYDFVEEMRLVGPVLLVAMGHNVFETLRSYSDLNVPLERVIHSGYLARQKTRESALTKLRAELARVKRVYSQLQSLAT